MRTVRRLAVRRITRRRGIVWGTLLALPSLGLVTHPTRAASQIPEEFTNLQVLPEDIEQGELIGVMRGFALGLGVRCTHCHVGEEGRPFSEYDFSSDDKEAKRKARFMLRMVNYLNEERLPGLSEVGERAKPAVEITCQTCHNGKRLPRSVGDVVTQTLAADGIDAAVARYRELREQYYGSASYDFSEMGLFLVAGDLAQAGNADAAVALATLNLEYHPESVNTLLLLAQVHVQGGDTDAARAAVQRAIEIDPGNRRAARLLSQLDGR